jgi:O-glycosyl hydrolase
MANTNLKQAYDNYNKILNDSILEIKANGIKIQKRSIKVNSGFLI